MSHRSAVYETTVTQLRASPRTWLVTGAAGFIGSNLVEELLSLGQQVVGVDNFVTGHQRNLDEAVSRAAGAGRFEFIEGDLADRAVARRACAGADVVLHQAALGSVPRSIANPEETNRANVDAFLATIAAAHQAGVRRFVYAGSSAVYGDDPELPKREERIGRPLSPYAVTKRVNELYAEVFAITYGMEVVGLRYFNVFGPRQDPEGPYAAVIPRWIGQLLSGEQCEIYGDGETSRDFCYVDNVVQANLLAAAAPAAQVSAAVFNVAAGARTTLTQLFSLIRDALATDHPELADARPRYMPERAGDVRHSLADISKIRKAIGYTPSHTVAEGLRAALPWYRESSAAGTA